ncbi:MAG: DNA-3-methyladenine glycosylase I, partial [Alphaproteobacteria bacterium]|nr:DNA-3-methyladenine glycosylase I [Alphaproteobacteria bacterium]
MIELIQVARSHMKKEPKDGLLTDASQVSRCAWCGVDKDYQDYHDKEWGVPVFDDQLLFQKICLEGFQAGLSWITILRKRNNFLTLFDNFDYKKISKYNEEDVTRCISDA